MRKGIGRGAAGLVLTIVLAVLVAACGSSSNTSSGSSGGSSAGAQSLLTDTFSGSHAIKSGVLGFNLTVNPSGSSQLKGPITLSLSGPFQSRGAGKLPLSNLLIDITALGHHGQLGLVSTGSAGYVTLKGAAYQLPASEFQKLASSFTGGSGTGGLAKFGIKPLHWLTSPGDRRLRQRRGHAHDPHPRQGRRLGAAERRLDLPGQGRRPGRDRHRGAADQPVARPRARRSPRRSSTRPSTSGPGRLTRRCASLPSASTIPVSGSASTLLGGLTLRGDPALTAVLTAQPAPDGRRSDQRQAVL